jgi:hypothetical protein
MRAFYLAYPIRDSVRRELSWTHYRLLLKVERPEARSFYEKEAINSRWSTRELERQINSLLYIILCAEKNNAVVRYTLPEDNKDIFVSKYKLYLPTEEELVRELERERRALEPLMRKTE